MVHRCELLGLDRPTYYLSPAVEPAEDLRLMRLIDQQYLKTPFYGSRRMTAALERAGESVNRKRVQRLMRRMGLEGLFPGRRASIAGPGARAYPYLLRDLQPPRAVMAALEHVRQRVPLGALDEALSRGKPEIFNTDQGSQLRSREYTGRLEGAGVAVSRAGRGRAPDNVSVERPWRSVKYEDIYLKDYEQAKELEAGLTAYFRLYNEDRPHQWLDYRTPGEVYRAGTCDAMKGAGS
jgi:putative transposase